MRVRVKLFGVFRNACRTEIFDIDLREDAKVRELAVKLVEEANSKEFQSLFLDPELNDPRPNAVILISGREISTIQGLDSPLRSGDEVTILPVAHGGLL